MTEAQYIDATNLSKLRIVDRVIRDTMFMDVVSEILVKNILRDIQKLTDNLEKKVKCD